MPKKKIQLDSSTLEVDLNRLPKELDASTISDRCLNTTDLIHQKLPSNTSIQPVATNAGDVSSGQLIKTGHARVLIGSEIILSIHRVFQGAGSVLQAFTVFPREKLEVEITDSTEITKKHENTRTIIDSFEEEDINSFINDITKENSTTKTNVTSWKASAGGSIGVVSASANVSNTNTINSTARQINKVVQSQTRRAARSRKSEVKVHKEYSEKKENTFRSKREIFNPNYDIPLDISIYESLGHFIFVTQLSGFTLVYQDSDMQLEFHQSIRTKDDVKYFCEGVATSGNSERLQKLLIQELIVDRHINGTQTEAYNLLDGSGGYIPDDFIPYHSDVLDKDFTLRLRGIAIGINEVQLPSGDVLGHVVPGSGEARGDLAKKVHDQNYKQMSSETELVKSKAAAIRSIQEKLNKATTLEEAEGWAKLLVQAMEYANHTVEKESYFE
ncbi:MAG: hypothetical protein AB2687_17790 [Candidatus Thiodiazotropha taylori]